MKLFCAGIKRGHGIGKESKNPYDMMNMLTLAPIQPGKMGGMTVEGFGYELIEMPVQSASVVQSCAGVKFPCVLDVTIELRPYQGEYKTTITGFAEAERKAA
jgi:hypothetical protein